MQYRGFTLDPFQETAIGHLEEGRSVLVSAPTGTGKTIIADWVVDEALKRNKQVIYTAPIKALSNQKFRDYCRLHGEDRVGLVTGDLVIRRDAPCLVMTTEILRNMLLGGDGVEHLYAVVIDEVHFLDDRERGTVWEEVLIYLPPHVLIVALSATLPNLDDFAGWMTSVRDRPMEIVTADVRAVPLDFHFANRQGGLLTPEEFDQQARKARFETGPADVKGGGGRRGRGRGRGRGRDRGNRGGGRRDHRGTPRSQRTHPIDVFKQVRNRKWLPMLYFVFSRADAERFAKALAFRYKAELLDGFQRDEVDAFLQQADLGTALDDELRDMYLRGIAFHHAGLHVRLKAVVEELYERKLLPVLFCTATFALGINMPARTAVLHGIMAFDGESVKPLPVRTFMQKAGRAGRRGLDEAGHVIIRMDYDEYPDFKNNLKAYFDKRYEPVRSSFNLSWNSIVKLLDRHDLDRVRDLVDKSFLSWHLAKKAEHQLKQADDMEATLGEGASKKQRKQVARLRKRADEAGDKAWQTFLDKRSWLYQHGYLADGDTFQAGAKVLQHLQISEIFATECVLDGVFEGLGDGRLFGLLCAMTGRLPRSVDVHTTLDRKDRELLERVDAIRHGPVVTSGDVVARTQTDWEPGLFMLGRMWGDGERLDFVLSHVHSRTDFAGSLVMVFRRAKELCSQLVDVQADMPDRAAELKALVRKVSRDEVEVVD